MRRFLQTSLVLVAALFSGGQVVLLQLVAWAGMLVGNVVSHDVGEAVARTFDGEHPCSLCRFVREAEESQSGTQGVPSQKLRLLELGNVVVETVRIPLPSVERGAVCRFDALGLIRREKPRLQPPCGLA